MKILSRCAAGFCSKSNALENIRGNMILFLKDEN